MKLYEVKDVLENIEVTKDGALINMLTGELLTAEEVEELEKQIGDGIEGMLLSNKNDKADAEALKAEAKRLTERAKAIENKIEWRREYVKSLLNGQKFKTKLVNVYYQNTESVEITDLSKIPDKYLRFVDPEPQKTEIKKAIKAGEVIEGAVLVPKTNMVVK